MAFDGSGNFNRVMNWVADATAGTKILASRHDSEDDNLAAGLSNTLTKDGQSQPTANIPMNGKKLVNLGAPTTGTDAATKTYVDSIRSFSTSIILSGATPLATIAFTVSDIGFGARAAGTPANYLNRFVWNDKPDLSGNDVGVLDELGRMSIIGGHYLHNIAPITGGWQAMTAGFGGWLTFDKATGTHSVYSTAASLAAGAAATPGLLSSIDRLGNFTTTTNITASGGSFIGAAAAIVLAPSAASGQVVLRPNGQGSTTGQAIVQPSGDFLTSLNIFCAGKVQGTSQFEATSSIWMGGATGAAGACYLRPNGIGSTSAQFYIDGTNGNSFTTGSVLSGVGQFVSTTAAIVLAPTGAGQVVFRPNGAGSTVGQFFVDSAGLISTSQNLTIAGSVATKATAGSWVAPSDIRLKDVLGAYAHGLAEILQVNPKTYTYKTDPTADPIIGVIAQDIETFMPECVALVDGEIDGKTVTDLRQYDMTPLTYALVNAVKELSAKLDQANLRIEALEGATS